MRPGTGAPSQKFSKQGSGDQDQNWPCISGAKACFRSHAEPLARKKRVGCAAPLVAYQDRINAGFPVGFRKCMLAADTEDDVGKTDESA